METQTQDHLTVRMRPSEPSGPAEKRALFLLKCGVFFSALLFITGLCWISPWYIVVLILFLLVISLFNFPIALFFIGILAISRGTTGFVFHTQTEAIIDDIYFLELYFPIFFASFLLELNRKRRFEQLFEKHTRETLMFYVLFVVWVFVGIQYTEWKLRGYMQFCHTLFFFFYLVLFSTLTTDQIRMFMKFSVFWGLVFFVMAVLAISGFSLQFEDIKILKNLTLKLSFFPAEKRAQLMSPPAVTAVVMGFCAWNTFGMALMNKKFRFLYFLMAFAISVGIFYTRTRSEMVGFLFAGFLFVPLIAWRKNLLLRGLALWMLFVILIWVASVGLDFSDALKRFKVSTDTAERASLGIRIGLWKDGIRNLAETYGMGVGTGGFFQYKDRWPHAHNVFFSVIFDLGIIGFTLWIVIYLNLWRHVVYCLKIVSPDSVEGIILLTFAAFFVQLSLTSLLQHEYNQFVWWLFPGLLMAAINNAMKMSKKYRPEIPAYSMAASNRAGSG